jgi:hypothetical protein
MTLASFYFVVLLLLLELKREARGQGTGDRGVISYHWKRPEEEIDD